MIHASQHYNRIQDPENKIAEDEPVFLLRAQDKLAPAVLRHWAGLHVIFDGDPVLTEMIRAFSYQMEDWQKKNGCKVPDLPKQEGEASS